jgi:pimeloyl-ACP methyl ester carboxylesterase
MDDRLSDWEERGRYIRVDGRPIFVWELGEGPPLLVLHGFPASSYDWRLFAALTTGRRVVAIDFAGFGLSDKSGTGDYSLFTQTDIVEAVARECDIESCDLIAHDMGDSVAAELLARHSESGGPLRIDRAVLTNGSIFIDMAQLTSGQRLFLRLPPRRLRIAPPARLFRRQLRSLFSKEHPVADDELEMMEELLRHGGGIHVVPLTIRYIEERRQHSRRWVDALVNFDGPLALMWGAQDPVAVVSMVDRLMSLRPDVKAIVWEDVGHWPPLEVPDRLAAEVQAFLA